MASFGDNIRRLFKKIANQQDQHGGAESESQLDGTNEARIKQLSERAAADIDIADSEFLEETAMPKWSRPTLQASMGNGSSKEMRKISSIIDPNNILHEKDDAEQQVESLRVVSFNRVISHRRLNEEENTECLNAEIESQHDEPESAGFFAGKLIGTEGDEGGADWRSTPMDALAPGKAVNPTEESFKQVAVCTTTSPSTLTWLSSQPSAEIRAAVASNPHVPQDTLRKLSTDADASVRLAVASNKRTPDDVLKQLTHDDSRLVSGEAYSALALREKASAQSTGTDFKRFAPPKVNPVQTKVPVIGGTTQAKMPAQSTPPKPPLPTPQFSKTGSLAANIPITPLGGNPTPSPSISSPIRAKSAPSPTPTSTSIPKPQSAPSLPPFTPTSQSAPSAQTAAPSTPKAQSAPSSLPPASPKSAPVEGKEQERVPSDLPTAGVQPVSPAVTPKMVTPRSLPKPTVTSPPPTGLPRTQPVPMAKAIQSAAVWAAATVAPAPDAVPAPANAAAPAAPAKPTAPEPAKPATPTPAPAKPAIPAAAAQTDKKAKLDLTPPSGPDGHDLLSSHKFKTTSNHLEASYTDLDAINIEIDTKAPNTWLSLNSEGAIKAYKTQKDTVKDVKMNLSAHNPNGPKHYSPQVNITPNASASETIAFLKLVAGRVSTPIGRLKELAEHASDEVREAAAENASLPPETFMTLARDTSSTVKLRLIDNSACPPEVLAVLHNDSDPYVAFEARNALKRMSNGLLREREQMKHQNPGQPGGQV